MQTTNQTVLFSLLANVILPGQESAALAQSRADLATRAADLQRIATLPVPFRSSADWLLIPGAGYDWAFMPIEADPLYTDKRGFPMPKPIIKHLRGLKRQGVDFDAIWIAHEVKKGRLQPGQPLTVADLMPPLPPKRRPAWQGALLAGAGFLGFALLRGAFGFGQSLATPPPAPTWTPTPAAMPARATVQPTQPASAPRTAPAKAPERTGTPTASAEPPPQRVEAAQPASKPTRPPAQRSEPLASAPAPEPAPRRQRGRAVDYQQRDMGSYGQPANNVWWGDSKLNPPAGSYLRPDLSQKNLAPAVETTDGRVIYPNHWGSYRQGVSREEYLANSCEVDPILFGVNVEAGIADLYFLGAWAYR